MRPEKIVFDNGLTLILEERPEKDVTIDLFIPSGHADCVPETHFLEHMAFKSTPHRSAETVALELERNAIRYGAWTHPDRMQFHMLSPPPHVETALQLLYECYSNDSFRPDEVAMEKNVLIGELLAAQSNPYASIEEKMKSSIFANHPLNIREETIDNIQAVTPERLTESKHTLFFRSPVVLGVAGQFNAEELTCITRKTFGTIPVRNEKKQPFPPQEPRLHEMVEERTDMDTGCVLIAFPVVGLDHPDTYALDFLSHLLGGSRGGYTFSNRLYQEIRATRGLAYEVHTLYEQYPGVGMMVLSSSGMKKQQVHPVKNIILEQLKRLTTEMVGTDELARAKTNILADEYRKNYTDIRSNNNSVCLAELYAVPGGYDSFEHHISTLTPQHIKDTAQKYFDGRYFIGEIIPTK